MCLELRNAILVSQALEKQLQIRVCLRDLVVASTIIYQYFGIGVLFQDPGEENDLVSVARGLRG